MFFIIEVHIEMTYKLSLKKYKSFYSFLSIIN